MKIISIFVAVAALAAFARAGQLAEPDSACRTLVLGINSAAGVDAGVRCEAVGESLVVRGASDAAFDKTRQALFPKDLYLGYRVERAGQGASAAAPAVATEKLPAAVAASMRDAVSSPNFDGAVQRSGLQLVAGPPGSGNPQVPPGSGVRHGPPGSGNGHPSSPPPSGGDDSPSAPPPPSRPTPVFIPRSPSPNWWNTVDWGTVSAWNAVPQNWDQDYFDSSTNRYISHWYRYSSPFVTSSGYSTARATGERNVNNQGQSLSATLDSQEIETVKQCYYQAVYNLYWNNTYGRWDGDFQYYRAACIANERYGHSNRQTVRASFDMQGQSLWPWERETLHLSLQNNSVDAYIENPAFTYSKHWNGSAFEFVAGSKLRTAPDAAGVRLNLVNVNGTLQLQIFDRWGAQYASQPGETIDISVRVKYAMSGWFNPDQTVYQTDSNNVLRFTADAKGEFAVDLPNQAKAGEYYVDAWSFRRINPSQQGGYSTISRADWSNKGQGPKIRK
jgi:hypothetical protein